MSNQTQKYKNMDESIKMMNLWFQAEWAVFQNPERFEGVKKGLKVRFDKNVEDEVKRAVKEFCKWLREIFLFPIQIVIYIKNTDYVKLQSGEKVSAKFWGPYVDTEMPYASIAAGGFDSELTGSAKDNQLAALLCSIGHELSHYYQWLSDPKWSEEKSKAEIMREERQARYYSKQIVDYYANTREHP